MKLETIQRLGGAALVTGAILFAAYSVLFATLLPVAAVVRDITPLVDDPAWVPLALIALLGIVLMMGGFAAVYSRLREGSGALALVGFLVIEVAWLLQSAKVTWEACIYPVLAGDGAFAPLLRDGILKRSAGVAVFRGAMTATIFLGIVLFCAALWRSNRFPKTGPALFFSGALLYGLGPALGTYGWLPGVFILAAGCSVLGARLLRPI